MNLTVHPWIGSNPLNTVNDLKRSALLWNVASTITTIAMGAISFSVMIASFFVNIPVYVTLLSVGVISPALSFATSYCHEKAVQIENMITFDEPVAVQFEEISSWKDSQIISFLNSHQIKIPNGIPLRDLLPLIARFKARCKQSTAYGIRAQELLSSKNATDREIRLWQRLEGWKYLEKRVLPARIEAAFVINILRNPTNTDHLSDHFSFVQKSFAERILDKTYDYEDHYLEFRNQKRNPLNFDELKNVSDPQLVYEMLYG